ncbi:T9SS type B sorting domain-containing protein [Dinghuibacter silviterrae]|uniref:Gliding motility-associated-like protein n=1 Tax=Dinghuibacter silviterrae TaxID=1539049 RepID=A0A4R8DHP1_9BACT|nr:gliding motility-associated C-terminal domain-containing protein [Dinghuibacter silviterrae]TDW96636.1 gliding motility-associated-like protein [Dinghuibacter silviterrae]
MTSVCVGRLTLNLALLLCAGVARAQLSAAFNHPDTVCLGAPVTLTNQSTGATSYSWNFCNAYTDTVGNNVPGCPDPALTVYSGATPPAFSYSIPGTYTVCLTATAGAATAQACHPIVVKRAPTIVFGTDTFFCAGQTAVLNAPVSPGIKNTWNTGSDSNQLTITVPGTYSLTSTYYGCTLSQTTTAAELANPSVQLPKDTVFCDSGVLKYTTNQPVTFIWNTGSIADTALVTTSGTYWLQLNERGCTALDSIHCKVVPTHSLTLGKDTSFCGPGRLIYHPQDSVGVTYLWNTGSDSSSTAVLSSGTYTLAYMDTGCTATASIQCTVIPKPHIPFPADTTFCDSGMLRYTTLLPVTYYWNTGATGDSLEVTASGLYKLIADNNGCADTSTIQATVAQAPVVVLPADTTFCGPGVLRYVSPLSVTYSWNTGSASAVTTVTTTGLYTLTVDNSGCTATGTSQVTVKPVPQVDLGNDTAVCLSKPFVLDAGDPGDTYLWQDGSTGQMYAVTQAGAYTVTVTDNGCSASSTIHVSAADVPYITLGGPQPICPGETIVLQANPDTAAYTYTWQDGTTGPTHAVTVPGIYTVTATDACTTYTASVDVQTGVCVVRVPNAFTPNGDGYNDVFRVLGTEVVDQFSLTIYDRWGRTVYASRDKEAGWDGGAYPTGTYVYELHFRYALTGSAYMQKGTILLAR